MLTLLEVVYSIKTDNTWDILFISYKEYVVSIREMHFNSQYVLDYLYKSSKCIKIHGIQEFTF